MQNKLINSENKVSTRRFHILWPDEYWDDARGLVNALPWYKPFNAFLHCWTGSDAGLMHDHPRWSISIVLKGALLEQTPKKDKWLTPGSVVFRRSPYVHRLIVPDRHKGKTWTLFIVGRRVYRQHYYHDTGGTSHRYEDNP
jgi:hypothetical protein